MLSRKTVLVIGAGAGAEISMPVGNALSTTIGEKTDIRYDDWGRGLKSGDPRVAGALKRVAKARSEDYNAWRAAGCAIRGGINYTRSIDAYLNTHKDNERVRVAAKLAIVQSILEAERECAVALTQSGGWKDSHKVESSWLPELVYILQDGVVAAENLNELFSNLCIVNFNYDRCVEHFLFFALKDLFQREEQTIGRVIDTLTIHHPYGQVGYLNWQKAGHNVRRVDFGGSEYEDIQGLAEEIRTFNEQVEEEDALEKLRKDLAAAERIVFIGFHFHKQNMNLMTTDAKYGGGKAMVFGTILERSGPEGNMLTNRIKNMLGEHRAPQMVELARYTCKQLFREYGTTWMK